MICPNCGKENQEGAKFCVECGNPLNLTPENNIDTQNNENNNINKRAFSNAKRSIIAVALSIIIILCGLGISSMIANNSSNTNDSVDSNQSQSNTPVSTNTVTKEKPIAKSDTINNQLDMTLFSAAVLPQSKATTIEAFTPAFQQGNGNADYPMVELTANVANTTKSVLTQVFMSLQFENEGTVYAIPGNRVIVPQGYEDLDLLGGSNLSPSQKITPLTFDIALPDQLNVILNKQNTMNITLKVSLKAYTTGYNEYSAEKTFNLTVKSYSSSTDDNTDTTTNSVD